MSDFVHFEEYLHYTCRKEHNVTAFSVVVFVLLSSFIAILWVFVRVKLA